MGSEQKDSEWFFTDWCIP